MAAPAQALRLVMFDLDGTLIDPAPEIADAVNDTLAWRYDRAAPPMFFGTLDRRRRFNTWAVEHMRAQFPGRVEVIDFEAMTARGPGWRASLPYYALIPPHF